MTVLGSFGNQGTRPQYNSPRLPAERRLKQADPDPGLLPPNTTLSSMPNFVTPPLGSKMDEFGSPAGEPCGTFLGPPNPFGVFPPFLPWAGPTAEAGRTSVYNNFNH